MERAVVRMYFEDGSFKTFLLVPTTTAKELCEQVRTKLQTNSAYYLFATPPGEAPRFISENEKPWPLYQQHAEKCKFVFRLKGPGSGGAEPELDLLAGFNPLPATPQASKPAGAGGNVTADDFDALLGQLQFDVGGMNLGAGAPADPFAAIDLSSSTRPPCSACGQPIVRNLLTAFGMQWHKEHLACAICKRNFLENDVPVVEGSDGKAYCQPDYLNKFAPKCTKCTKPIQGECTNALGKQWHPACFVCKTCNKPFTGTFFEHEGHPYCEPHYYQEKNLICPECEKPIIGKCITAKGKRYHPQHFVCSHCKKKLAGNEYFTHESKLFCKTCSITFYG